MKYTPHKYLCTLLYGFLFCAISGSCTKKSPERYIIGVSQCSNDEWRQKMNLEMQHEALLYPEISLNIRTVTDDTEKQIEDIENFIRQKVDLIVVAPNQTNPVTPVIEKAYKAGIPVIVVDRKINSENYTAFIGADNRQIGSEVGNYVSKLLGGKGNIVEIRGLNGSSPDGERHSGFVNVINNYPEINLLASYDGAWLKALAETNMEKALAQFPQIDLVFAHNDRMAVGAFNIARKHGKAGNILFVGIDALPGIDGGIEQVLNHRLKATFIYPTAGDKIIQLAMNILQKRPYEKNNTLYTTIVDETNAQILKLQTDAIIKQEEKINVLNSRINGYVERYVKQNYLFLSAVSVVVFFTMILILLLRAYNSKNRLNLKLKQRNHEINEQKELLEQQHDQLITLSKQLEEATHAKLVFFTNISHEFRTPLTLISGPVNSLLSGKSINIEQRRLLELVQKNIKILLKLIDQIIDFRKYENGKMILNLSRCDLKAQIVEWNDSFAELARKRNLHFSFNTFPHNVFVMPVDIQKMERIYFNLLSNALKFTPPKGVILINLDKITDGDKTFAVIEVANSGKGISDNDITHIFERFYQVDSHAAGSGIGLALTKAMVELHGGDIAVSSEKDGWTKFTVRIPFTSVEDGSENEIQQQSENQPEFLEENTAAHTETFFEEETLVTNSHTVLVVDDNPDIRSYTKIILQGKQYKILEAADGEEGFQKAVKHVPDIIISDVMMPKMDGVELCRKLKTELSTSHIPIILLTACSLDEQRIIGFQSSADEYITKPFNSDVLEVRIANLIESRKRLKELFGENLFSGNPSNDCNDLNRSFLGKLKELIEKNLSDSELNVEDLGQHIGLSRTQLYRKVKSLTNYSPNELLRIIRLKKAYHLLSTTEANISEVTYDVGFTSPSYFAKCFKDYYNESPTDFVKR
ncbi:MAG: substrate-binding domain-containing protein, partial [Dysgonamonadaceae bacterium]|nr:substrate-binding domain-containing protein [Dysgonamonadaceae bacterium]